MTTAVHVNTTTHAATHVATNMLNGIRNILKRSELNPDRIRGQWAVLENGMQIWLASRHLKTVTLEVFDPNRSGKLVGRFDFTIDYGYYPGGDGDLWLDPDAINYAVRKNGSFPSRCDYTIIVDLAAGWPDVPGWASTTYRSTEGFARHVIGTAIGGGSLGAGLAYYTRSGR